MEGEAAPSPHQSVATTAVVCVCVRVFSVSKVLSFGLEMVVGLSRIGWRVEWV